MTCENNKKVDQQTVFDACCTVARKQPPCTHMMEFYKIGYERGKKDHLAIEALHRAKAPLKKKGFKEKIKDSCLDYLNKRNKR